MYRLPTELAWLREQALELVAPTRCCGCERPGMLICDACLSKLELIDPVHACKRCGAPFGDLVCTECARDALHAAPGSLPTSFGTCLALASYTGPLPRIIRAYKDAGEERLAPYLAELMLETAEHAEAAAPERYGGLLSAADGIVFVPATHKAYLRRGFDHMEAVAQELARLSGIPLLDALAKRGKSDQRKLGREGRAAAQHGAYVVVCEVVGKRLLLVDDVITTGATMRAASAALARAGAVRVDVLALARVC